MPSPKPEQTTNAAPKPGAAPQPFALQFMLGNGRKAEVRFTGGEPEAEHIQKLEAYLKLTRESLS